MEKRIFIASDHTGVGLKNRLASHMRSLGLDVEDLGTNGEGPVDYPDYGYLLARKMEGGGNARGVLICGTGIGISIAANRASHIRAALCHDELTARLSREHNDANVLALGARIIDEVEAVSCLNAFLDTDFAGGRHSPRVEKLGDPIICQNMRK